MGNGPGLVIRGSIVGALFVIFLTAAMSTSANYTLSNQISSPQSTSPTTHIDQLPIQVDPQDESHIIANGDCLVSTEYPERIIRWCALITHYSQVNGLEPDLIAALIWQESGGDPRAYSKSGAVGLMQVMPRDGIAASFTCVNGPCFRDRPKIADLEDPEFNIKFGTRMLAQLVKRNGSLREGLKSYGPMNVGYTYADKVLSIYNRHAD